MSDLPEAIENSRATTVPVASARAAEYSASHAAAGASPAEPGKGEEGGKYVYCIIRQEHERELRRDRHRWRHRRVYTVHHSDLAAVVSDTPIVIYDPTRENVLAHEFVNETVMREFTVIPMSFGTVFRSEEDVSELLRSTYRRSPTCSTRCGTRSSSGSRFSGIATRSSPTSSSDERRDPPAQGRDHAQCRVVHVLRAHAARPAGRGGARGDGESATSPTCTRRSSPWPSRAAATRSIGDRMILNAAFLVDRGRSEAVR